MHHERNITCKVVWSYQQLHVDIYIYKFCSLWFDPMGARTHDLRTQGESVNRCITDAIKY